MKREPRTEIVSVRLTRSERDRLNQMGGVAKVIREALQPERRGPLPLASAGLWPMYGYSTSGVPYALASVVWEDGTVGPQWPASVTR